MKCLVQPVSYTHLDVYKRQTDDFNSNLVSGESRGDSTVNKDLYCASGSAGAVNPSDYAAFMRYGFRSSLNAKFTLGSLGFRCAADGNN